MSGLPTSVTPTGVEFISSSAPEVIIQPLYDSVLLSGVVNGTISMFQQGIGTPLTFAAGFGVSGATILNSITTKTLNWTIFPGQGAGRLGMPQTFRIERCSAWVQSDAEFRQARAVLDLASFQFIVDDKPYWKTQLRHIAGGSSPSGFAGNTAITQFNLGPADSQGGMRFPIPVGIPSQHDFRGELNFDRSINFANPLEEVQSPALQSVVKLTVTLPGALSRAIK
jgi:hypothetical protein